MYRIFFRTGLIIVHDRKMEENQISCIQCSRDFDDSHQFTIHLESHVKEELDREQEIDNNINDTEINFNLDGDGYVTDDNGAE